MAQVGSILREARMRAGLSLREISDITKVRVKYLEALEEENFKAIPSPTFIKAYLRTYANTLGLDPEELIEQYRVSHERRKTNSADNLDLTLEQVRRRSTMGRKRRPARNQRRGYALLGTLAIVAVVLLAYFGSGRGQPEGRLGVGSVGDTVATTVGSGSVATTLVEAAEATTTTSEAVFTGNDVWLKIEAKGTCFLIVREDDEKGRVLHSKTLARGDIVEFTESKRYWLNVGSPNNIRLFIDDHEWAMEGDAGTFIVTETGVVRDL